MNLYHKLFMVFLIAVFAMGFAVCLDPSFNKENMQNLLAGNNQLPLDQLPPQQNQQQESPCPDVLIRSGTKLYLHNSSKPKSDTNPLVFEDLPEYLAFLKKQRNAGVRCPVLFLQEESNTQGQTVYRMRPGGPTAMGELGGLQVQPPQPVEVFDASRDGETYNQNHYAGFDSHGQHVGQYTELDQIHRSTATENRVSDNPMDSNWGGVEFSRQTVKSGKYEGREVGKPRFVPKITEIYK